VNWQPSETFLSLRAFFYFVLPRSH